MISNRQTASRPLWLRAAPALSKAVRSRLPRPHRPWLALALLALLLSIALAPLPAPAAPPALQGDFLRFWEQHNGARELGPPLSPPIWLDGRLAQLFARGLLEQRAAGVASVAQPAGWLRSAPSDLLAYAAAPQRVTLRAPALAEPLLPITVTLSAPGYRGPAELRLYDAQLQTTGVWPVLFQSGAATAVVEGRGALGPQQAVVLIDGKIAGASSRLFKLDAQTSIETGQPRFDQLYPLLRSFLGQDTLEYILDGRKVRGYRSPDNDLIWLRDHTYQGRAFRYFERDLTSTIDAFRRAQRPDGSFPDYLARPQLFVAADRKPVEADLEYLFVQAVYEAWQASGDDSWLRANLPAMRRGIAYLMSDPLRWDDQLKLIKRPFTIDTWDFQYGPTTIDPSTGARAPRHWLDGETVWGIFHGDNTGLASALRLLAKIEQELGNADKAASWRREASGVMARLDALSWNGRFYTHQVHLTPLSLPGVDESQQLSLSNAIALNRGVLRSSQARAIVDEYYRRFQARGATFAEWYSIDPPYPAGSFGLGGGKGEQPGEYVNGGLMPLVGGELSRGAFRVGAERYGFDILARYAFMVESTGASYLWYYPAGNPGKSGTATIATDGWGASAMLAALVEGAAGVEDQGALYRDVRLSPRWPAAGDVGAARVVARYAASDGYVAYRWQRADGGITLDFTGSGARATLRLLLPEQADAVKQVVLDGVEQPFKIERVFGSRYVVVVAEHGSGRLEISW